LIAPLKNKVRSKEVDKLRMRSAANETERNLQTEVSQFDGEFKQLSDLVQQIDSYTTSNKSDELQRLSSAIRDILGLIEERKQKLLAAQPELESARNAVLDQERHKKNLKQNIDIMESTSRIKEIKKDIARLEQKRMSIEGYDTVYNEFATVRNNKERMQEDKARLDGRFSEIAESVRSIKVSIGFNGIRYRTLCYI
jgi:DNA repair protein RAD50